MVPLAVLVSVTESSLEVVLVVFLLLPAVRIPAPILHLAAFPVELDLLVPVPELARLLGVVIEVMGLASEVLPVVRVHTLLTVVFSGLSVERAPDCFEMEHVEVVIMFHFVEDVDAQFFI